MSWIDFRNIINETIMNNVKLIRRIAKVLLFFITSVIYIYALISGSENLGGEFIGILRNFPNTLAWILLFSINYLVWKNEMIGGIILIAFGLLITWFFNFTGPNFWWSTFTLTSLLTIFGVIFMILSRHKYPNQ